MRIKRSTLYFFFNFMIESRIHMANDVVHVNIDISDISTMYQNSRMFYFQKMNSMNNHINIFFRKKN